MRSPRATIFHLLLHADTHAHDVPLGRVLPARTAPAPGAHLSAALPLTNAVELVRPLFMDQWPAQPLRPALVLALTTLGAFWLALALTRRRFRG